MAILIPDMEMPENCCVCPVNDEVCHRGYEYLLKHTELYDKRADDCPLIEVKTPKAPMTDRELEESGFEL